MNRYHMHRCLSLDGRLRDTVFTHYRGRHNRSPLDSQHRVGSVQPFQQYDPDPGRMDVLQPDYDNYESQQMQHSTPMLRMEPLERPKRPEPPPEYEDCLMTPELSEQLIGDSLTDQQRAVTEAAERGLIRPADLSVAPELLEQTAEHHFQPDPIAEMASELEQIVQEMPAAIDQQTQEMAPLLPEPDPEELDPYQQMIDAFDMMDPGSIM